MKIEWMGTYYLASGYRNGRLILAEGWTRNEAWRAWLETFEHTVEVPDD